MHPSGNFICFIFVLEYICYRFVDTVLTPMFNKLYHLEYICYRFVDTVLTPMFNKLYHLFWTIMLC